MDENQFVTGDSNMGEEGSLHEMDKRIMGEAAAGEGIPISPEQFLEMARAAYETKKAFDNKVMDIMTEERARFVKNLRCEKRSSWRLVAQTCYDEWNGNWEPPFNQLMGIALCEAAAKHFDENFQEKPWNSGGLA